MRVRSVLISLRFGHGEVRRPEAGHVRIRAALSWQTDEQTGISPAIRLFAFFVGDYTAVGWRAMIKAFGFKSNRRAAGLRVAVSRTLFGQGRPNRSLQGCTRGVS